MGSLISISIGITLLALTGGMFLLAKVKNDALGTLFKVAAWTIIICCVINLGCTVLRGFMKFSGMHARHEMKMHEKMEKKHKKWKKRYRNYHAYGEFCEGTKGSCGSKPFHTGSSDCRQTNHSEHCKTQCSSDKDSISYKLKTH
jgi:hypothetical protein